MATFNPAMIVSAAKSAEFAGEGEQGRNAKAILLDGIAKQIELFKNPLQDGRRWFSVGKTEVAITLRVNNKPLPIMGTETKVVVPLAHFEEAMLHFKQQVEKGQMDDALKDADEGISTRREKLRATRAEKKGEGNKAE